MDYPQCPMDGLNNPTKQMKEGCLMLIKGIKGLVKHIHLTAISLNIGFIGLRFAGGSS